MFEESTRQFDFYDIVSVIIPGAVFIVGLVPLFPNYIDISSSSFVLATILFSFVSGRSIHALGLFLDSPNEGHKLQIILHQLVGGDFTSHREEFCEELINPSYVGVPLVSEFYSCLLDEYSEFGLPESQDDLSLPDHQQDLTALYVLIRGSDRFICTNTRI